MITKYSRAWEKYKLSIEHNRSEDAMSAMGLKQPYIDNILQSAFSCGWNAKEEPEIPYPLANDLRPGDN